MGAISTDLSLQDYEEQCRYTQKNIFYASPKVRDHSHYFVFTAMNIHRKINHYCANCPIEYQKECFKKKFETNCPPEFVLLRGGEKVPFYERSGYPERLIFLLKTKRKIDGWEVPRGFVVIPMVNPETVQLYDVIKKKNIDKLESQEDNAFKYKRNIVDRFVQEYGEMCIKMQGGLTEKIIKVGSELKNVPVDNRKYAVVNQDVIEGLLYDFLKAQHRFTMREVKIMVALIREKLSAIVYLKNQKLFEEKGSK
jgi:hypothetical protein